jgi:PAS domain S-box-containing protein
MQGKQAIDPAWRFEHKDGRPMALAEYPVNLVLASRQPLRDYVVGVHRSDQSGMTWVLVNAFPEFDEQEQLRQVVVTFVDISGIRQVEAALRESEAVLRSFFESPGIMRGIVELVDGDILHITDNPVAAAFFGRTPAEMRNQLAMALGVPRELVQQWIGHYETCRKTGQPVGFTYEHKTPTEDKWFAVLISYLGQSEQDRPRFTYAINDITSVKRLEAQLLQAQKMEAIGQLAGGIAHDFNNILQAINGFTEMAQEDLEAGHAAQQSLSEIAKAGARAAKLVGQLLAFSRRQVMEPANLDLNEVVGNLIGMLERVIGEHIRLDFIPGHHLGTIRADRTMMEQMLLNLCVNARDAMPQGGRLTIETENIVFDTEYFAHNLWARPGRYILISITDTGCGMESTILEHIFEPFFSTKGPGKGTGLGLSTVYGIVRQHEGMVRAYSEVGKGTTFKVYLPVVERPADAVGTKIESLPLGGNETILVAEDDDGVRELARETLTRAGYTVLLAKDGPAALALFKEHAAQIKLLLLDVVMPELGGREVFDQIHAEHPALPALFASGYSENAIHTNFVLQEGMKLIRKPYDTSALLRAIRTALDNAAAK